MNKLEFQKIINALVFPVVFVAIAWLIWYFDSTGSQQAFLWGIHPGHWSGLTGIFSAPLLHDPKDVAHILNNTTSFLFMGWALFYFFREISFKVFFFIWIIGGFWVWLIGQHNSYHVGASGVLYGLASFLFFSGVIRQQINLMGLTLLVTFLYGGMIWGIFPYDIRISWESHLFGGIAGLFLAIYFRKTGLQRPRYDWENDQVNENFAELSKIHEEVIEGKIPDPNINEDENKTEDSVMKIVYSIRKKEE